jgi:glyoxylase-like metal-dependent hydrolase (beta-lactamase superfamily II)
VIWTAGHTPGSIALRHGERGVLFTGDTAAERGGAVFLGPFNTDRERAKESFRRLAEPGVTTVCFGHGDPLLGVRAHRLGRPRARWRCRTRSGDRCRRSIATIRPC